jgi:peptide chain release factor 2
VLGRPLLTLPSRSLRARSARRYTRYFDARGWSYSLLSSSPGDVTGYKSLDYEVTGAAGDYVYGMLKKEKGAHRLVRVSPFNSAGKRMTTFAGVTVSPVIKDLGAKASVPNFERDCTVDTMRSGGKGGQNVNKVETAVRMTHVPSGLVVKVSKERTQQGNRRIASKLLQSRVLALMEDLRLEEVREINGDQVEAAWGRQIRNYVLHPYKQVKDLRSGYETADVGGVLDGKLDDILESVLTAR